MTPTEKGQMAAELFNEEDSMIWQPVESSQIAEIGYDASTETLGIKFPAGKRSPASEYHYKNVNQEFHAEFLAAESIGSFFGKNIKSRPDLYPFMKIEPETLPGIKGAIASFMEDHSIKEIRAGSTVIKTNSSDGATKTTPTQSPASETIESPSTALAVIDAMTDDLLFTPGAVTDAQLAAGRDWYLTEAKKYDIATEKARAEFKRFARPLQKLRTGIEARARELTGATKRKIAAIDAEKRRLVGIVGGIEDEVLAPLTSWEAEEEARKMRLSNEVKAIENCAELAQYFIPSDLESRIAYLKAYDVSSMQEFKVSAESAIVAVLKRLEPELERMIQRNAEAAELAQLRAEAAKRAEQDRMERVAKEAREQAERKAQAELERVEGERVAAIERAERAEKMRIADEQAAVVRAQEALARADREQKDAVEAERKRNVDAAKAEYEAMELRAADEAHRNAVHNEIRAAILKATAIDDDMVMDIIVAIADGLIPHVRIEY